MNAPILIIGAGQAGLQIAESLRAEGFDGRILLVGDENLPPYQRPPLSKAWLAGETADDRLFFRGAEALAAKRIELVTGRRAVAIDPAAKKVRFEDGGEQAYAGLALATGCRPRRPDLPGASLEGTCVLRDIPEAHDLSRRLDAAENVVIVGGGFIGLEVAAAARKRGKKVTLVEAQERLMARAVTPGISAFFADLHRAHGATLLFSQQVAGFAGEGSVSGVTLASGATLPADLVVLGIGAHANDELASAAGVFCARGIVIDDCSRTSHEGIVAAGDCAIRRRADGSMLRLESVQAAVEQAKAAAAALMGREKPFVATPWFWSDQYDCKLQIAGLSEGADLSVKRRTAEKAFSLFCYREGRLIAVESINRPGEHMLARRLLDAGLSPAPQQAADPACDLKAMLK
jgi:3-phenylpropionate/trans-cinnamate dioxygenase ferredoxin reductase subunit